MIRPRAVQNFFRLPFSGTVSRQKDGASAGCPQCGYTLERPHAMTCPRCGKAIPGASGCSNCGRCRKRRD